MSSAAIAWGQGDLGTWNRPVQRGGPSDRLHLLYSNDIHEKYNLMPNVVTAFQQLGQGFQQQGEDVLKLSAGDWNVGKEPEQLQLNVLLNNLAGINASTLGNHEYDAGAAALTQALNAANYPVLASNLEVPQTSHLYAQLLRGELQSQPMIWQSSHGVRYGLIGLTAPDASRYMNPDANMEGVYTDGLEASIQKLQAQVNQLQAMGVQRIIAVTHVGYKDDLEIARRTQGLDIVVGGHSHTQLKGIQPGVNFVTSASGEPVMIVQTGKDAKAMGVLDVAWDAFGRVIPSANQLISPTWFPKNPLADQLIDRYLGPQTPMARMAQEVDTDNAPCEGENGVADAIADAAWQATNTDITFFKGNELRNDIAQGVFTDRDLKILLPFNDPIVAFEMTGDQIMAALNESARCLKTHDNHPGILHPAGLRYTVDRQTGKATQVTVFNRDTGSWAPLSRKKHYSVAVGEFLAKNKKEYPVFKTVPVMYRFPFSFRKAFGQWILSQQGTAITFPQDGRLTQLNANLSSPRLDLTG